MITMALVRGVKDCGAFMGAIISHRVAWAYYYKRRIARRSWAASAGALFLCQSSVLWIEVLMQRPRNSEEYVELVRQAVLETEELRQAAEYDTDEMAAALGFLDPLEAELRKLYATMQAGNYAFADVDLPFMAVVDKQNERVLPFKRLLRLINLTHRQGLDAGDS
jgi:hypothetical protein